VSLTRHSTATCSDCGLETALQSFGKSPVLVVHYNDAGKVCGGSGTGFYY